jgi:hypothetical protein
VSRRPRRRSAWRGAAGWLTLAVLLAGCELGVTTAVEVDRDGGGTVALALAADPELLAELDELAVDPTAEIEAAVAATDGWRVERRVDHDGLRVTLSRSVASPDELTATLRELSAGLASEDPALELDLDLDVAADGASALAGTAGLRAPAGPGVLGDPQLPDAGTMQQLTAAAVEPLLEVTLPGPVTEHDGDDLEGRTVRWQLPVGEQRTVGAAATAPSWPSAELVAAGVAGGLVVLSAATLTVTLLRRRRTAPERS